MIVGSSFASDDSKVGWAQHDVYGHALWIITSTCTQQVVDGVLEFAVYRIREHVGGYDHRTLQGAHDLLAAAWRFYHAAPGQPSATGAGNVRAIQQQWLDWLRAEVRSWTSSPELTRHVQAIMTHQNKPIGYLAESRLGLAILDRFPAVPWNARIRHAYEEDLAKDLAKVAERGLVFGDDTCKGDG